jgi:hemin uptake protein HemP
MNARPDPALLRRPLLRLEDPPPIHDARTLTQGGVQARILLDGQLYCLRITRAGKLILTK